MRCRLCNLNESIENSHVIPRLVFRAIKSDSPTGFLRDSRTPNKREQDGDKQPLLCLECENKFSVPENLFAQNIFVPFHEADQDAFSYGPWLHYFLTSLAWRTLALDLPGFQNDPSMTPHLLEPLQTSLNTMRTYLCGATHLGHAIRHHAFIWTAANICSPEMAAVGPNVLIRRSTIGYTLIEKRHGYAAVVHNLAGFITILNIKGAPRDNWLNTKIVPDGGRIAQPQKVTSWVMHDLLEALMHGQDAITGGMSEKQQKKIFDGMKSNPNAPALRHAVRDAQIDIEDREAPGSPAER